MIDQIWQSIQQAATGLAGTVGEGTKEKTNQLIEDWLKIFPQLEIYGLAINSFSLGLAISPSLQAELISSHEDWTFERLDELMQKHRGQAAITMVFTAIRTAYRLHQKTLATRRDPLIVKVSIRLSPEVRVVIGQPLLDD
ncbi:hypothetical protein CEQ90_03830 [Lewinellaceae bacterium SD302]|nr:hypothetical protein CEQ90_03830 [Lewinellaceae bacterium SD302]